MPEWFSTRDWLVISIFFFEQEFPLTIVLVSHLTKVNEESQQVNHIITL